MLLVRQQYNSNKTLMETASQRSRAFLQSCPIERTVPTSYSHCSAKQLGLTSQQYFNSFAAMMVHVLELPDGDHAYLAVKPFLEDWDHERWSRQKRMLSSADRANDLDPEAHGQLELAFDNRMVNWTPRGE